ncbi:hypothetical protein [uncultured Photobacterium sp.]|uniref:hypothetical protein n=1 Tax=uncultured Photobacterium sp. TaxID=173973 RepID=UPI002633054F|nr:hypothetical protein [uncultured Photobacterium sp.]
MKTLVLLLSLVSSACYSQSIVEDYSDLSTQFIRDYSSHNNVNASKSALKQLDMDPSDSTALLRLSVSITPKLCEEIKTYYLQLGSKDEIQEIAQAIIKRTCKFND